MNVLTALDRKADYSKNQLQMILAAWVTTSAFELKGAISKSDGDVSEDDYDKRSVYSLVYALYRTLGTVPSETGELYEFTFNTWGYTWPEAWGPAPTTAGDPQRFGKNAYAGLFHFDAVRSYVAAREGRVHVVELGCGTGAGAHHVCSHVLPQCTYEAVDMQRAAIETCNRKFVPELNSRLRATCADATVAPMPDATADIVVVNETHVTEQAGRATAEDELFFKSIRRVLKPGGYLVWGNAIPDSTWKPCFDLLDQLGMKQLESVDVTKEAVDARDQDQARIDAYVDRCIDTFHAFRIPVLGARRRRDAEVALKNLARNPGTMLYQKMKDGTDTYKVSLFQKPA
jgi:SAM-dependent methyltransferase